MPTTKLLITALAGILVIVFAASADRRDGEAPNGRDSARGSRTTDSGSASAAAGMRLSCASPSHKIHPHIYGTNFYPLTDAKDGHQWKLNPAARRWGGNHTSRYNWRLGNAWNAGADWFFRNLDYIGRSDYSWRDFLRDNHKHGVGTALTVPLIGWVAKDLDSSSFPVSVYGPQKATDPYHPEYGNGHDRAGRALRPGPPSRTSVPLTPKDVGAWVRAIRAFDKQTGRRNVDLYLLDNEPMLWHIAHRDVHPEPLGYDELLERTIAYAREIRRADPDARIGGPCVWGWPAYFFSAKDAEAGFFSKPDRRAHGDVPLLAWYLRQLRAHEARTGERLLDVLDVHFYPQDLPKDARDDATRARRIRSTRGLWDPTYKDESWIEEPVMLLPRLSRLIAENYPGRAISIGEYNFGAEDDMSGGLALAEALGRLGQHPDLNAAFYWTYPADGTPAHVAFRAFRDYDGKGGRFQDHALRTEAPAGTSLFASRDAAGDRIVAVALNFDPRTARQAMLALEGCRAPATAKAFQYTGQGNALTAAPARTTSAGVQVELPPYSITVIEISTAAVATAP